MGEWQPIETAPKDGRVIRVLYDLEGLSSFWDREINVWWNDGIGRWVWEGRACRSYSEGWAILGWQPLPEPPQSANMPE